MIVLIAARAVAASTQVPVSRAASAHRRLYWLVEAKRTSERARPSSRSSARPRLWNVRACTAPAPAAARRSLSSIAASRLNVVARNPGQAGRRGAAARGRARRAPSSCRCPRERSPARRRRPPPPHAPARRRAAPTGRGRRRRSRAPAATGGALRAAPARACMDAGTPGPATPPGPSASGVAGIRRAAACPRARRARARSRARSPAPRGCRGALRARRGHRVGARGPATPAPGSRASCGRARYGGRARRHRAVGHRT